MIQILREEILRKGGKIFKIEVTFDGENYTAGGYLDGYLINETSQAAADFPVPPDPSGPEIENLIFLIKDDILSHEY